MRTQHPCVIVLAVLAALLWPAAIPSLAAQGLPGFAPINPLVTTRSGLYFQPYVERRDAAGSPWQVSATIDYATTIESNHLPESASYLLDSELLRLDLGATRDLGGPAFLVLDAEYLGAYDGFLDGFLDWYHGLLGIEIPERDARPSDSFAYRLTLPDGTSIERRPAGGFLGDLRAGLGVRYSPRLQSVLSLTLPTATGPSGYGRGTISLSTLHTYRASLHDRVTFEGSLGVGVTPRHGELAAFQRTWFVAGSSGLRYRFWGRQSLYANLYYESPSYHGTSLPALDRRSLALDFGWLRRNGDGTEWKIGLTEDLEPAGPAIDLIFRFGRSF